MKYLYMVLIWMLNRILPMNFLRGSPFRVIGKSKNNAVNAIDPSVKEEKYDPVMPNNYASQNDGNCQAQAVSGNQVSSNSIIPWWKAEADHIYDEAKSMLIYSGERSYSRKEVRSLASKIHKAKRKSEEESNDASP